jgi:hypothetical protein
MSVVESVAREIGGLGEKAAGSVMAETALSLAHELDGENSATSKSMCAKALIDVMRELRVLAPPRKESDDLAKLRQRRDKRRSGGSRAKDSSRS